MALQSPEPAVDNYAPVNAAWPETLPPINTIEARRASRLLARHFGGQPKRWYPSPVWTTGRPLKSGSARGWWRLVHDVAHDVFEQTNRHTRRNHGGWHAELELAMVRYVLAKGWLAGSLKPIKKPALTLDERRAKALSHAQAQVAKWERALRRAQGRLKTWRRKERAWARRLHLEGML